jgi:DNA polymerase III alpha subunit
MASFTLEDQTGAVRVVAFPDAYERYEKCLVDGTSVLVTATLRASDAEHAELALEEAMPLEGIEARKASALRVELDLERFADKDALEQLHELFLRHEGRMQLRLRLVGGAWQAEVVPNRILGVDPTTLVPALTALLGPGRVEYVFSSNGA